MGKATGFKEFSRAVEPYRPAKERVLDFVKKITREDPNAYTIRTAAEFVSDYTNEYNVSNDIKQK